jgi:hypothetical protein
MAMPLGQGADPDTDRTDTKGFRMLGRRYPGKRTIWGDRATVRSALYLAMLVAVRHNPPLRMVYRHLLDQNKEKTQDHRLLICIAELSPDALRKPVGCHG